MRDATESMRMVRAGYGFIPVRGFHTRRIAALAAQGLSNPQIAHELYVTRETVESHLTHLYRKLGIRSRAELPRDLPAGDADVAGSDLIPG